MKLTEKTLKYDDKEETVYFRELTAGEQLQLAKGQKFTTSQKEGGSFEVDLGDQLEKNYKLVQLTLVTQDEKRVYPGMPQLFQEPKKKIAALVKLAVECNKDDEDAGNA